MYLTSVLTVVVVRVVNAWEIRHQQIHLITQSRLAYTCPIGTSAVVGLFRKKEKKKKTKEKTKKRSGSEEKHERIKAKETLTTTTVWQCYCASAQCPSHVRTDRPLPQTGFVLGHSSHCQRGFDHLFQPACFAQTLSFSRRCFIFLVLDAIRFFSLLTAQRTWVWRGQDGVVFMRGELEYVIGSSWICWHDMD